MSLKTQSQQIIRLIKKTLAEGYSSHYFLRTSSFSLDIPERVCYYHIRNWERKEE